MVYVSIEDFYEKAGLCRVLARQEELEWAEKMMELSPLALRMIKRGLNAELDG